MLKFLGNGSCFNTEVGNNSCYYYNPEDKSILLIDCGESVFERIMKRKLLGNVQTVDILITHLHSDHAGSLPSLLFACQFGLQIKPTVIYPEKEVISDYLRTTGNEQDEFLLATPEEYERFDIRYVRQNHSKFINAFGYLLCIDGKTIYYSGDAHDINPEILNKLNVGEIDEFYQDVTRYDNSAHLNIDRLNEIVLPKNRDKVICMHFDDGFTKEKARELGFKCAETE
ncbi:MAG: MBL fold metallo-hydrolase [Oscillospiraceae bacterium]|jgi:ribonuclease BN (tRNA processing enzyme)|nr:MBL fold metallo-hydrolase [Oscillospiraceae bacterium]